MTILTPAKATDHSPPEVAARLKTYVDRLIDPRNGKTSAPRAGACEPS